MYPPDRTFGSVHRFRNAVVLRMGGLAVAGLALVWLAPRMGGQVAPPETDPTTVHYALSFPEPEHRWMHVSMTATGLSSAPLSVRMSVSSPGRYARHGFAKNVFDIHAQDGAGNPLEVTRTAMSRWDIDGHDGTVQFGYRVYGDRIDGTYLAIDDTHAHLNMPAVLMWGHGLENRPAIIQFELPAGKDWRVATQLYPSENPFIFTAPNLQYLLDSPAEVSQFAEHTFNVVDPTDSGHEPSFRIALHHRGGDTELTRYARDVEDIVREMVTVFDEFPRFETGRYTFIADYLPGAHGDAMEHRNSTVLSAPASLRQQARGLLGSVSHEFFHVWNVERIRPASLEPFDFEVVNPSGELWLAEGFTNYYGTLILQRAGLRTLPDTLARFSSAIDTVRLGPGRQFRSASDMSWLAPFVDAASAIDRTNWDNVFISYYTWGEVLGLGLDLLLRTRSAESTGEPSLTLDDYMRLLWQRFGRGGATTPGVVDRPYTPADARAALADVTQDRGFADEFFDRYVDGHEVIDFAPLVERAGLRLQPRTPDRVWFGSPALRFEAGGARVVAPVPLGSPLYDAGVARDDRLVAIDGRAVSSPGGLDRLLSDLDDGQAVSLEFHRRDERLTTTLVVEADPTLELVSFEQLGARPTPQQLRFRDAWLGSQIGP
ncbi:MAG: PDZ domain-containing protein [Acidobacteriota bacterium]|nr:PDZ domain-containing protein [Acidobacteriota bacterium]